MKRLIHRGVSLSYLSSPFHEFWSRCGNSKIHPDDVPFFDANYERQGITLTPRSQPRAKFETAGYGPCPFDGPLQTARVVVCFANPNYSNLDPATVHHAVLAQRAGDAPLPKEWDWYYRPRIAEPLSATMDQIRQQVSLFNVCPYASTTMDGPEIRLASGLPSVWAAQKHLREVLIPLAKTGNIFLVVIRKHQLWGITEGFNSPNIAIVRGRELGGFIPKELGKEIRQWLISTSHKVLDEDARQCE